MSRYGIVLNEINGSSDPLLQPIRLLAQYLSADASRRQQIVEELSGQHFGVDEPYTAPLIAALIFLHEKNFVDTLRTLHGREELEWLISFISKEI